MLTRLLTYLFTLAVCAGCAEGGGRLPDADAFADAAVYEPHRAEGMKISLDTAGNALIEVTAPWQGADGAVNRLYVMNGDGRWRPVAGPEGCLIAAPAKRIIAMSSTHVAMLDQLGCLDRIAGVSGKGFIHNPAIAANDCVVDVGNEADADFETLAAADPDLVLLYGVMGASAMEPKLRQLGIPYVYIGDYLEQSPLGKAEWLIAMGVITGQLDRAVARYRQIEEDYEAVRDRVAGVHRHPTVMFNAPYGDSWLLPSPNNYMARLVKDAGGEYVADNTDPASDAVIPIDNEDAYRRLAETDFWLNPGTVCTRAELEALLPRFGSLPVVTEGRTYNNNLRLTAGGGNDFYETGAVRPDLVLRDLATIFHPGVFPERFTFYRRLQ